MKRKTLCVLLCAAALLSLSGCRPAESSAEPEQGLARVSGDTPTWRRFTFGNPEELALFFVNRARDPYPYDPQNWGSQGNINPALEGAEADGAILVPLVDGARPTFIQDIVLDSYDQSNACLNTVTYGFELDGSPASLSLCYPEGLRDGAEPLAWSETEEVFYGTQGSARLVLRVEGAAEGLTERVGLERLPLPPRGSLRFECGETFTLTVPEEGVALPALLYSEGDGEPQRVEIEDVLYDADWNRLMDWNGAASECDSIWPDRVLCEQIGLGHYEDGRFYSETYGVMKLRVWYRYALAETLLYLDLPEQEELPVTEQEELPEELPQELPMTEEERGLAQYGTYASVEALRAELQRRREAGDGSFRIASMLLALRQDETLLAPSLDGAPCTSVTLRQGGWDGVGEYVCAFGEVRVGFFYPQSTGPTDSGLESYLEGCSPTLPTAKNWSGFLDISGYESLSAVLDGAETECARVSYFDGPERLYVLCRGRLLWIEGGGAELLPKLAFEEIPYFGTGTLSVSDFGSVRPIYDNMEDHRAILSFTLTHPDGRTVELPSTFCKIEPLDPVGTASAVTCKDGVFELHAKGDSRFRVRYYNMEAELVIRVRAMQSESRITLPAPCGVDLSGAAMTFADSAAFAAWAAEAEDARFTELLSALRAEGSIPEPRSSAPSGFLEPEDGGKVYLLEAEGDRPACWRVAFSAGVPPEGRERVVLTFSPLSCFEGGAGMKAEDASAIWGRLPADGGCDSSWGIHVGESRMHYTLTGDNMECFVLEYPYLFSVSAMPGTRMTSPNLTGVTELMPLERVPLP